MWQTSFAFSEDPIANAFIGTCSLIKDINDPNGMLKCEISGRRSCV